MIELKQDALVISFPEVHPDAKLEIDFQRTLRIPDDDREYPLPPGLGRFPLRHIDDFANKVPGSWLSRGGVMLPMYQSEALWLNFSSPARYPFAVKVATGKINAVTGDSWSDGLRAAPQDYLVAPGQPWLDGYCAEKGVIRQFVAMPLGSGYSAEEQLTGEAEHGGIQIMVYPMKADAYERLRAVMREPARFLSCPAASVTAEHAVADMGLAPGGRMRQEIYDDPHQFADWQLSSKSRCFVHLANALVWREITGANPPTTPPTAHEYTRAGLPWFQYYSADRAALDGAPLLSKLKSVMQLGKAKKDAPLPENKSVDPVNVITLREGLVPGQVREGAF
jgi:hypothetical protein